MSGRYILIAIVLLIVATLVFLAVREGEWAALVAAAAGTLIAHVELTRRSRLQRTITDSTRVAQILEKFPGPVVLAPTRTRWLWPVFQSAVFGAIGLWMLLNLDGLFVLLLGGAGVLMFVASVVYAIVLNIQPLISLQLADTSFELRYLGRRRVPWSDTSQFEVAPAPATVIVYDDQRLKGRPPTVKAWGGRNSAVPNFSPFSLVDLALVMNRWRERALLNAGPPNP
jgi:hypothetical protein